MKTFISVFSGNLSDFFAELLPPHAEVSPLCLQPQNDVRINMKSEKQRVKNNPGCNPALRRFSSTG